MEAPSVDMKHRDTIHIFSEFEDKERQGHIRMILAKHPELDKIPRGLVFSLWFADMERLRRFALETSDVADERTETLLSIVPWSAKNDAVGRSRYLGHYPLIDTSLTSIPVATARTFDLPENQAEICAERPSERPSERPLERPSLRNLQKTPRLLRF